MRKVIFFFFVGVGFFVAPVLLFADNSVEIGLRELLPVHIVLMSLAGAGMITGAIIARYFKRRTKKWVKLHKAFQWGSAVCAVLGIVAAVIMVEVTTGIHLRVAHSIVAVASFGAIVLAITAGYGFLRRKTHKKELRIMHRWLGRVAILAWLVTITLGLFTPLAGIF
jgi:preprotein translocase subunit YajC